MKLKAITILLLAGLIATFISCDKSEVDGISTGKEQKIQLKAIAEGAVINYTHIGINVENRDPIKHTLHDLKVTSWVSDIITTPKGTIGVLVLVDGKKTINTGNIKIQLLADGKVVKEATSVVTDGSSLRAQIMYLPE